MKIDKVEIKKMHHRDGPDTERAAAHKVAPVVTGRRREVLEMLASMERGSGTDIANKSGLSLLMIRPRLTELQEMNLIQDTETRKKNQWGNSEIVWKVTEEGQKYVN